MNVYAVQPLEPIRARLRSLVTALQAVEGAAELAVAIAQSPVRSPTAYVVLSSSESQEPAGATGVLLQSGRIEFSVVLAVRNYRVQELGAESATELESLIASVQAALLRWRPDGEFEVFHVRGQLMQYDAGVLFWREDFARRYRIRKET